MLHYAFLKALSFYFKKKIEKGSISILVTIRLIDLIATLKFPLTKYDLDHQIIDFVVVLFVCWGFLECIETEDVI